MEETDCWLRKCHLYSVPFRTLHALDPTSSLGLFPIRQRGPQAQKEDSEWAVSLEWKWGGVKKKNQGKRIAYKNLETRKATGRA